MPRFHFFQLARTFCCALQTWLFRFHAVMERLLWRKDSDKWEGDWWQSFSVGTYSVNTYFQLRHTKTSWPMYEVQKNHTGTTCTHQSLMVDRLAFWVMLKVFLPYLMSGREVTSTWSPEKYRLKLPVSKILSTIWKQVIDEEPCQVCNRVLFINSFSTQDQREGVWRR